MPLSWAHESHKTVSQLFLILWSKYLSKKKSLIGHQLVLVPCFKEISAYPGQKGRVVRAAMALGSYTIHMAAGKKLTTSPKPEMDAILKAARFHFFMGPDPST